MILDQKSQQQEKLLEYYSVSMFSASRKTGNFSLPFPVLILIIWEKINFDTFDENS